MRRLTIIVLAVAALYSAYWVVGARTVTSQATSALSDMQAQGWDVRYSDLGTKGFPNRFDTTLTDIALTAPDNSLSWRAPFVQVFALSYQPNKVIAVFPNSQTLTLDGQDIDIMSEGLRASTAVGASTSVPLREVTVETGPLSLTTDGAMISLASGLFSVRDATQTDPAYNSYLTLTEITPPFDAADLTGGAFPSQIDSLVADVAFTATKPIDRFAGEGDPLLPTSAAIRGLTLTWGDSALGLTGDMTINPDGEPTGDVTLTLTNWQTAFDAVQAAGLIDQQTAFTALATLRGMADGDDITLDITLTDGSARLGFIPLPKIDFWD